MKLKYKGALFLSIISSLLSSCSLRSYKNERLFLYSTFTLNHAFDYQGDLMNKHSFISSKEGIIRDSLFEKKKNIVKFYPLNIDQNPIFDLDFTIEGKETIQNKNIQYVLKENKIDEMTIELKNDLTDVVSNEIYVFPNFWLRIHIETIIENVNYNLILEYKNTGKTVIPE